MATWHRERGCGDPCSGNPSPGAARCGADRLDLRVVRVGERENAAGAAFQSLVPPDEGADDAALVEHQLDVAADILRVKQAFLETVIVEGKHVLLHQAAGSFVRVFECTEIRARRLAYDRL